VRAALPDRSTRDVEKLALRNAAGNDRNEIR
jgi:hypothetical protein